MAPAKSASKKSETQQVAQPVAPKEEVKKTTSKKATKTEQAPVETPVKQTKKAASKKETVAIQEETAQPQEEQPRQKRVVSKESVDATFTALTEKIIAEIERLREAKPKAKGVKFLKTLNKEIKQLHSDCNRVTRFRKNSESQLISQLN